MMHRVASDDALGLIEISTTSVEVAIEAREVTARNFDANAMPGSEVVARSQRRERYLVNLARLHPDVRPVVTVAIAHPLNRFVEVVRAAVGINVKQLNSEISVLRLGGNVERHLDWTTHFDSFLQRLRAVNKHIRTRLVLTLIERTCCNRVAG